MKKTSLLALALTGALLLGGGGVFAAGQIARSNAISEENARNFAYVDAGVLPEKAEYVSTKFDFSKGRFVYEIEFIAQGIKYEYTLDSATGAVIEKERETIRNYTAHGTEAASTKTQPASAATLPIQTQPAPAASLPGQIQPAPAASLPVQTQPAPAASLPVQTRPAPAATSPAQTQPAPAAQTIRAQIGVEAAKSIALADAGKKAASVVFTKARQDKEEGRAVYEIEFYESGQMEYEYEIDAYSGAIIKKEMEMTPEYKAAEAARKAEAERKAAEQKAAEEAARKAEAERKAAEEAARKAEAERKAAEEAARKASEEAARQAAAASAAASTQPQVISVDKAKEIALRDAGLASSQVQFEKAMLDRDDGRLVYEIEFFIRGQKEYDYEIDACTGQILERDVEDWDD